jgi:hypothetical protein
MQSHEKAGKNHKIDNRPFRNVAQFKYLGMTVTYQNLIQEEIESRFNSGIAFTIQYRILSSWLLSKNIQI